jgi:phosphosulfolactate synthase (CoM biosynthesis protein A)
VTHRYGVKLRTITNAVTNNGIWELDAPEGTHFDCAYIIKYGQSVNLSLNIYN